MARSRLASLLDPPLALARLAAVTTPSLLDHVVSLVDRGADGLHAGLATTADGIPVLAVRSTVRSGLRRRTLADMGSGEAAAVAVPVADLFANFADLVLCADVIDAAAVGGALHAARRCGAEGRLWLCSADRTALTGWRGASPAVRLVQSIRIERLKESTERVAATLAATSIDGVKMSVTDWSGGLTTLFHRFDRYCISEGAEQLRELDDQVSKGLDVVSTVRIDDLVAAVRGCP